MEFSGLGSLGAPGSAWAHNNVVNSRLSAPRGEQFSIGYVPPEERDTSLRDDPDFHGDGAGEADDFWTPAVEMAIPRTNLGFRLLQRMGWVPGKGLGRNEDGILEPIRSGAEAGVRLGLGKQEEDNVYTDAGNVRRKQTEAEMQANEAPERTERRELEVERAKLIKEDVTQILRTFYCEICDKQYKMAVELEAHLCSYDHGHRKRLREAQVQTQERTRGERVKREQKQMGREAVRLNEQFQRAQQRSAEAAAAPPSLPPAAPAAAMVGTLGAPPLPTSPPLPHGYAPPLPQGYAPPLPPGSAPPLPPGYAPPLPPAPLPLAMGAAAGATPSFGISFGLGAAAGRGRGGMMMGRGGAVGRGPGGLIKRPGMGVAPGGKPAAKSALAGFGMDSDSDEGAS